MAFTQDFRTQRRNYDDGGTRIGEAGRIWYDSISNTFRVSDGVTPGGILISGGGYFDGGGGGTGSVDFNIAADDSTQRTVNAGETVQFLGSRGISTASNANGVITITGPDLAGYALSSAVPTNTNQLTNGAAFITASSLTGLATETYVTTRGYITTSALTNYALTSAIPTNNNQLTNGSNYITSSALTGLATETYVTTRGYLTTVAYADVTGKPTLFSGSYTDLTNKPTIPSDISQLTDTTNLLGTGGGGGGTTYITNNVENPFSFSVAGDDSTLRTISNGESIKFTGAGGVAVTTDAEGNITITGTTVSLAGYATESYVTSRGYITGLSWNQLTDKPNLAGTYSWSIAGDDSTLREISAGESVKFVGAGGITTSSDDEGKITITGPSLTGLATETYVTTQGYITSSALTGYALTSAIPTNNNQLTNGSGYITSAALTGLATETYVTSRGYITGLSWDQLTNKPNLAGTYTFNVAADDSTLRTISSDETVKFIGAGGVTTSSDTEGAITITGPSLAGLATETFVTTQGYITSAALTGLATESYVTSRGYITGLSWNQLTDKPNLAGTYSWSIAADDSTQLEISAGNLVKIVGTQGVTTTSNADGQITITGPDLSTYATQSFVTTALSSAGVTISATAPAGLSDGALWYNSSNLELYVRYDSAWIAASSSSSADTDYNDLTNKPTNVSQFTNDANYVSRDEVYAMILELGSTTF